jgi:predicted cupin superfamily sugar epimerase
MEIEKYIEMLQLEKHPEGGYFKEVYRSVDNLESKPRSLLTSIYFLLTSENVSRFHRIQSDELWYYHAGSPLIVHTLDEMGHHKNLIGNNIQNGELPYFCVPKKTIFGSTVLEENSFSLVSCAVAPGFDFEDFELFTEKELLEIFPQHQDIIHQLT